MSVENSEDGDIITFIDSGLYADMQDKSGKIKQVINFKVSNGRYELIYTPGNTALKALMKAWGRETDKWVGRKFQVKIVESISFGKPVKMIYPNPIAV